MTYGKAFLTAGLLILSKLAQAEVQYAITDLGSLGGVESYGWGINASGQVTGSSLTNGGKYHAFVYSNGVMRDIDTLDSEYSVGHGINVNGQVTGFNLTPISGQNTSQAFLYSNGVMTNLWPGTKAYGINSVSQIAGYWSSAGTPFASLIENGTLTELTVFGQRVPSESLAINDNGQVTGWSIFSPYGDRHAFIYSEGTMTDIGTLGGRGSFGSAINSKGEITGSSYTPPMQTSYCCAPVIQEHAFIYSNGQMIDLGSWGGSSHGKGINDNGQVVGIAYYGYDAYGNDRAFVTQNGIMTDLNTLVDSTSGWYLRGATGINNNGQITGYGSNNLGQQHAFLLTPLSLVTIPIPTSAWLFGSALIGLAGLKRNKYRIDLGGSLA